ncbi:MAG: hypothetical protein JNL51_10825 [Chitinophagaceae bacterium]|nr:hypothetical protein [Chitinophagaceae bacterium]
MSLRDYSPFELEPRKLSKEEIENPYEVIHNLFDFAELPFIREQLWELLKLTISGSYHKQSRSDRANLLFFYEKLETLVEAAHIIHQRTKKRPSG